MAPSPAAGATGAKSPKATRRLKTPEPRQVHFDGAEDVPYSYMNRSTHPEKTHGFTTANSPSGGFSSTAQNNKENSDKKPDPTPDHFPQVGVAPGSNLQWHTAANPSLSISHQLANTYTYTTNPQQQRQQPIFLSSQQFLPPGTQAAQAFSQQPSAVTYIGVHPQPSQTNMSDYQNTAPPPTGVHFQPPVPDTTFGPIPHVYVPRFDGGLVPGMPVPGVQVGVPSVHVLSPLTSAMSPACFTVVLPRTFYLNGYTYHASSAGDYYIPPRTFLLSQASSSQVARCCFAKNTPGLRFANIFSQQPAVGVPPQPSSYVVAQQPYLVQQPVVGQQHVILNGQPAIVSQAQPMTGVPTVGLTGGAAVSGGIPVIAGNSGHYVPEVSGLGRTAGEEMLRQANFAQSNRLYEPQDFKPSDDDPSRFYFVREVDGVWTQRSRHDIDNMGDCRWYVTDQGWFYAVRLA